jgi:hypothetical protein
MRTIKRKIYGTASIVKLTGIIIAGIMILCVSSPLYASYYAIGLGNGGDAKTKNITLEVGANDIRIPDIPYLPKTSGKRFLGAVGLTFMDHRKRQIPPVPTTTIQALDGRQRVWRWAFWENSGWNCFIQTVTYPFLQALPVQKRHILFSRIPQALIINNHRRARHMVFLA